MVFLKQLLFDNYDDIAILCGNYIDIMTSLAVKKFYNTFGCSNIEYENSFYKQADFRFLYLLNNSLDFIEKVELVIFCNTNPRLESPLLNARFRRNHLNNVNCTFFALGNSFNYNSYPITNIGNSTYHLCKFLQGTKIALEPMTYTSFINYKENYSKKGLILLGSALFSRPDANEMVKSIINFTISKKNMNITYGFLPDFLGRISFYEAGLHSKKVYRNNGKTKTFYHSIGSHSNQESICQEDSFAVYQGVFKNFSKLFIKLYLPSKTYLEQNNSYMNMEGRIRSTNAAVTSFRLIYTDKEIITILAILKKKFFKNNFSIVTNFEHILQFFSNIVNYKQYFVYLLSNFENLLRDYIATNNNYSFDLQETLGDLAPKAFNERLKLNNSILARKIYNYYAQDIYAKNSKIMSLTACKLTSLIDY